jgi:hypothetical protein
MTSVISRIMIAPVLISSLLVASEKPTTVLAKHLYANTQKDTVTHDKQGFSVNGQRVSEADVSKDLRGISSGALRKLFAKDKTALQVSRIGNDYRIEGRNRLNGGGPISGWVAYWVAKSIGYGCVAGAATAAVATVVVTAPVAVGAVASTATGLALGSAIPATATAGASLVAAGVATNAALASGTVVVAAELATTAAAAGGVVGAIETTSAGIGLFFAGLPFLP